MRKKSLLVFTAFLFLQSISAQQRSLQVGGKLINDFTFYDGYSPGWGGQLVYRIKKHAGIETGIYYKIRNVSYVYSTPTWGTSVNIKDKRIQIPVLYRFDSRILNFS